MSDNINETIANAFCEVLEVFSFMFGEPAEKDELPEVEDACISSKMTFTGDMEGTVTVTVPLELCQEIAANVLGIDEDDEEIEDTHAKDALGEMLNVICGQLLTAIAGETPVFDLSVPATTDLGDDGWASALADPRTLCFLVEDLPLLLRWEVTKGLAE